MDSTEVSLAPRGALEIVDTAADLLRRRTRDVVLVVAVSVIPVIAFALLAGVDASNEARPNPNSIGAITFDEGDIDYRLFALQAVISSVLFSVVTFAMTRLIVAEVFGHTIAPGTALRAAVRRAPVLVLLWVLVHLAELAGVAAFGVGLLFVMCALMVTVPALASEPDLGGVSAVGRSWRLTQGLRGHVFAVLLVLLLINGLLGVVLVLAPVSLMDLFLDGWPLVVVSAGFQAISSIVVEAIVSGATVYTYLDLRVRREGLDIDLRMRRSS